MDVKLVSKVVGFLAALSLASVAVGAPLSASESGPPTPASSEGNPSIRGSNLLNRLHENASRVRDEAARLEVFDREPTEISWESEGAILQRMRDRIDHMDKILHRLRSMEGVLPKGQQEEINKAAFATVELTDTTQAAIEFLNNNQNRLWAPQYTAYANEMYSEASRVERSAVPINENALTRKKVN